MNNEKKIRMFKPAKKSNAILIVVWSIFGVFTLFFFMFIGGLVLYSIATKSRTHRNNQQSKYPRTHPEMSAEREEYLHGLSERTLNNELTAEDIRNIKRSTGKK